MKPEPAPGLLVRPTETAHRQATGDDYVIVVHPDFAKARKLKGYAVVVHHQAPNRALRAYGRLCPDASLGDREIRLDQTLRNAIGIPYELEEGKRYPLELHPLRMAWRNHLLEWLSRLLGRRYLFLRVAKLNPPDIEKDICRVPLDGLRLLGTAEGNRIVLVSCIPQGPGQPYRLHNRSIKAFELSDDMLEARQDKLEANWSARYVDASKLLGINPDIASIFLDAHLRDELGLQQGDAIKVRRDVIDLIRAETVEAGILFFVSLLSVVQILPFDRSWCLLLASIPVALLLSAVFLFVRIRARVK